MHAAFNRKIRTGNNIFILTVFLMFLSGMISSGVVLSDFDRPGCYSLLWLLPAFFSLNCLLIYSFRKLLFTRASVTLITGLYWIRMVVTPVIMVWGDYAVVPENTSWQDYLQEAIILECYESVVIFLLLTVASGCLTCRNCNTLQEPGTKKIRYSTIFLLILSTIALFFIIMIARWPALVRYLFIPIFGAPPGWKVVVEQRSIWGGGGSGPLGILVTQMDRLFLVMQILLPATLLTWILNRKHTWSDKTKLLSSFILIAVVFLITTEDRGNSVFCALAMLLTLMSYSNKRQLRTEVAVLLLMGITAIAALWIKQGTSDTEMIPQQLSKIFTSYFSGPQNIAACIQATHESHGPNPLLIKHDLLQTPFFGGVIKHLVNLEDMKSCSLLFHQSLYGVTEGRKWDQILPSVGQGYLLAGFFFAPLISAFTAGLSIWLEKCARKAATPVWKNICYIGAVIMAFAQVPFGLDSAITFLWFLGLTAFLAIPIRIRWRRSPHAEYLA